MTVPIEEVFEEPVYREALITLSGYIAARLRGEPADPAEIEWPVFLCLDDETEVRWPNGNICTLHDFARMALDLTPEAN